MKRIFLSIVFVLALSALTFGMAYAQDSEPEQAAQGAVQIAVLLAPLVAAATAVERLVEMVFDWYESTILDLSKFPAEASNYVNWARKEVEKFKELLILPQQTQETQEAFLARLRTAEESLLMAQDRLKEYLSSPTYISQKRKLSLILGIVLGIVLALVVQIKMFSLLGIPLPGGLAIVDMLFTGLVIGTGSAPVHSLIGIIQNTKDAVDGVRRMWSGKATAEVQRVLMQYYTIAPGVPPAGAPAPLMGVPGATLPAAPEMSQLEMDRTVQRMLRSK